MISLVAAFVWISVTSAPPPSFGVAPEHDPPLVFVREDDRWSAVSSFTADGGSASLPIPFLSRSERVARATRSARGTAIAIHAGSEALEIDAIEARLVSHPAESQVLLVGGKPSLIGPPELAESIVRPDDEDELLPELARRTSTRFGAGRSSSRRRKARPDSLSS